MMSYIQIGLPALTLFATLILLFRLKFHNRQEQTSEQTSQDILLKLNTLSEAMQNAGYQTREEFALNRREMSAVFKEIREENAAREEVFNRRLSEQLSAITNSSDQKLEAIRRMTEERLMLFQDTMRTVSQESTTHIKESMTAFKTELNQTLGHYRESLKNSFESFSESQRLQHETAAGKLTEIKTVLEQSVSKLQENNEKKLEEMRRTVDEKLHDTLEKRLGESFKQVSDRLEAVHKGLGEMQALAVNVGDLKKVMSNVKTRGILGEYQLENILEDLLTAEQYAKNVKTKEGSDDKVEFAVKMPASGDRDKPLWLPIDAKFPKEDYERLIIAYDEAVPDKIEICRKAFADSILKNARDIREKYIDPPGTTEYGVMFLPFESLYAEVLRIPGLFSRIQQDYKITVAGPTTLSAFLNSLQMGFRTLAIEKRRDEIGNLLSTVKKEFTKFGDVLAKAKKKLDEAGAAIEATGVRSRVITRQLRSVEELPSQTTGTIESLNFNDDYLAPSAGSSSDEELL